MKYMIIINISFLFLYLTNKNFNEQEDKRWEKSELKTEIIKELKTIEDPELKINIYDLGLIMDINISNSKYVTIRMIFTKLFCPYGKTLVNKIKKQIGKIETVTGCKVIVDINVRWNKNMLTKEGRKKLSNVYSW